MVIKGKKSSARKPSAPPRRATTPAQTAGSRLVELDMIGIPRTDLRIKKILVPIDFSEHSLRALSYVAPLAKLFDSTVILLHVLPRQESTSSGTLAAHFGQSCEKQLNEVAREEMHPSIHTQALVRSGAPVEEILSSIESLGVDLVVVSTHGASGRDVGKIGSTAEQVVQQARCAVFLVRDNEH